MVSSFDFSCMIDHVGVMRRSVRKPLLLLPLGEVMMTEISVGVG